MDRKHGSGIVKVSSSPVTKLGSPESHPLLQHLHLLRHDLPVDASNPAEPFWQGLRSFVVATIKADEKQGRWPALGEESGA